ncbi:hypothetical protein HYQ45_018531 [Verticillium longisporum]|uniref:Uncharacterized protein n=1 Tax=Verticillium longisporum TaxID=100787 RepID=A0A8I2Z4L1_VERLO|nr:hypothetical protein HYQ45_018531 [Verticillium longisporum]
MQLDQSPVRSVLLPTQQGWPTTPWVVIAATCPLRNSQEHTYFDTLTDKGFPVGQELQGRTEVPYATQDRGGAYA